MQNQQMAQMQAQMNANGSVNGTPVMGNMAQPKRMGNNDPVEKLNTYIYDYFLRNRHHALARAMLDGDLKMSTEKPSPNKSNVASDIDMPDDMPLPALPAGQVADNSFLLDWWVQFWDIFAAARGPNGGPKNAVQYLGHNRNLGQMQNEQRNQRLMMANNPMANAQYMMARNGGMTNGKPTELQRTAHMNNRPTGNPMAGMQSMKNPNMIQMQRDGSNMDMNGNRPNSPGSNENAPSPNKRPRVEGGMNAGNMPNNQFNEFMPQGPGAQQKNIEGINSGVQGSPMAQSGLDGQDLTFAGNGPRPGSMPLSESSRPGGLGFQNTHPVQTTGISVQNHGNTAESALVSWLLRRIEDLERGAITPEHPPVQGPSPPRFQILHVLDEISDTVCLQEPTWTFDIKAGLRPKAESPLMNLDTYLRKNDDISFLVYKTYKTPRVSASKLAESIETGVLPTPEPSYESIRIMSQELEVALAIFLKSACSLDEEQHDLLSYDIPAPYLFWYRGRSKRHTLSHLLPKYRAHLELLFDWIERNYATKFDQFDEMISRGRISHAFTEYLFFPGDVVIKQDGDKTKAYQLQGMPEREKKSGRTHHSQEFEKSSHASPRANGRARANEAWIWEISCWTIVYDGQFYRQNEKLALKLVAESHDEEVDIAELTVVPLLFVGKDLQEQLLQRGRTFWSCRVRRPISYNGRDGDTSHTDGERYVIDNESYKKLHLEKEKSKRNQEPIPGISNNRKLLFAEAMNDDEPPQAPYIYLFPPTIPGFSLRRKEWVDLVVDKIVDVSWNKEAFKHLVADDKTKELVQALVADRISSERNTDLIQGKGNGLIILLHGGPGTGKTFTAESVAELAEKPLYPVTCGDIGTEPEQVERYLESVLYLGNLWDCVVLLDEADVFLEERGIADLARNALVSVFLRVLEYYDGILILTSNRVGTFDEAFKSRISLALHYPNFTKSQRCRIWKNFLNRLKALKEPDIDFDDIECNIQELASEELNGRQIRNAITIGRQLAKFQKKELSYAHLKHVVEVAGQFETYVKGTKENLSGEEIARAAGLR